VESHNKHTKIVNNALPWYTGNKYCPASEIHVTEAVFTSLGQEQDRLFHSTYDYVEPKDTSLIGFDSWKCDKQRLIIMCREQRDSKEPKIHFASGNQVMEDGQTRDRLAQGSGIFCFEMEAADQLLCLQ
jgi:hypothetical protein